MSQHTIVPASAKPLRNSPITPIVGSRTDAIDCHQFCTGFPLPIPVIARSLTKAVKSEADGEGCGGREFDA